MLNWRNIIETDPRYNDFTVVDKPQEFEDMFADQNITCVQVHMIHTLHENNTIFFCGAFMWKDKELIPLDGDSYNKRTLVYGYDWFENKSGEMCLDILVGDDW